MKRTIRCGSSHRVLSAEDVNVCRPGYEFMGWNTRQGGTGKSYRPGNTLTVADDVVLYAQWCMIRYTCITYNANGGTGCMTDTVRAGCPYAIRSACDANIVRPGYLFTGWNTCPCGAGTTYCPGNVIDPPLCGLTLYAQWIKCKACPCCVLR